MNRKDDNKIRNISPRKWVVLFWVSFIAVSALVNIKSHEFIIAEDHIRLPIEFAFRDVVGRSPVVDPRLKIIGIDDSVMKKKTGGPFLTNSEWLSVFEYISRQNPEAIIFDGALALDYENSSFAKSFFEEIVRNVGRKISIIVGGTNGNNSQRPAGLLSDDIFPPNWPIENCQKFSNFDCEFYESGKIENELLEHYEFSANNKLNLLKIKRPYVGWVPIISALGHISWPLKNSGRVPPVRYEYGNLAPIPHLGLAGAGKWKIKDSSIFVNEHKVPVDGAGYMPVNYLSVEKITSYETIRPAFSLKRKMEEQKSYDFIQEGDYVIILPYMYTGNPDLSWTPYGELPGGLVLGAIVNSALTGQFIRPIGNKSVMVLFASIIAAFCSILMAPMAASLVLFLLPIAFVLFCLLSFSYFSISIAWLFPVLVFLLIYIPLLTYRYVLKARSTRDIEVMLSGMVDDAKLTKIKRNIELLEVSPREKVVTVMFVDIEGFSLLVENMVPRSAFNQLKKIMDNLIAIIHLHGGVVDKTLGDGVLAYFGHDLMGNPFKGNHALDAVNCGIEIQKANISWVTENKNLSRFYPFRIGINTSSVFLGNLGDEKRIDYTVVGNGVNFAKRLESACQSNLLLVSESSERLLQGSTIEKDYNIKQTEIKIKHHVSTVKCFEVDPFNGDAELHRVLKKISDDRELLNRTGIRINVKDSSRIIVMLSDGKAEMKNFSRTGVSLIIHGVKPQKFETLELSYDSSDGELGSVLVENGIGSLKGEVQWSYSENGKTVVGILYEDLDNFQAQTMFEILSDYIG